MNAKSSIFSPAVIFACVLGVLGFLLLVWLQFNVTIEPIGSDAALLPQTAQPQVSPSSDTALSSSSVLEEKDSSPNTAISAPTSTTQQPSLDKQNLAQSAQSSDVAAIAGALRVSNQSDHPLRVALLSAPTSTASKPKYGEPVHWDFAPGEGGSQGLIVSLPEGNLKLKKGDILVAFAQDGSRRYWGPFVVGETDTPVLNRKTSEWQLILQP